MNCREELPNIHSLLMQQIHLVLTVCPSEGHSEGKERTEKYWQARQLLYYSHHPRDRGTWIVC